MDFRKAATAVPLLLLKKQKMSMVPRSIQSVVAQTGAHLDDKCFMRCFCVVSADNQVTVDDG